MSLLKRKRLPLIQKYEIFKPSPAYIKFINARDFFLSVANQNNYTIAFAFPPDLFVAIAIRKKLVILRA